MWKNNLVVAYRKLKRNKLFSVINILGLGIGMGVSLLICQYIFFEFSFDRFHTHSERIYRVTQTIQEKGEFVSSSPFTTFGLGESAKTTLPYIEEAVRVIPAEIGLVVINREKNISHLEEQILFTDPEFLDLFDFPMKYGSKEALSKEKNAILITEETATKFFGDTNPIGKFLETSGGVLSGNFTVSGVLKSLPEYSHLQFDILLPIDFLVKNYGKHKTDEGWDWDDFVTYLKIQEEASPVQLTQNLQKILDVHVGEELNQDAQSWTIGIQVLKDIHLNSDFTRNFETNNGNLSNLKFFAIIALFILLMAWVNYVNLSTAQAILRTQEIGIRKTIGAQKRELISQFMAETLLVNTLAALIAILIASLLLPVLQQLVGQKIAFTLLNQQWFWILYVFTVLIGVFFSGLYPAFVLTTFKPINLLSKVSFSSKPTWNIRNGLLVFQFIVSITLIAATFLVYQQVSFMKSQDLGMDVEEILIIDGPRVILESIIEGDENLVDYYQTYKNESSTNPAVNGISVSSSVPGKGYFWEGTIKRTAEPDLPSMLTNATIVDRDFFEIYGLEKLAQTELPDVIPDWSYTFINEAALKGLGFESEADALGKELEVVGYTLKIQGVIKNFHWQSLKDTQAPTMYILDDAYGAYFSVKMNLSNIEGTLAHLKTSFEKVFPNDPFSYYFLDDQFYQQYQADIQFGNLFSAFSLLAIFIACLGLFAMVSFSVYSRAKEIGVRKVLGANSKSLVFIFVKDYVFLIITAALLSIPIIYLWGNSWLDNFAYRIEIGLTTLFLPSFLLLLICLTIILIKIYSAIHENPVKALRSE